MDDNNHCIACGNVMKIGDRWLEDLSGGPIHFDCCGPEREGFWKGNLEPLEANDPIPTPMIWEG